MGSMEKLLLGALVVALAVGATYIALQETSSNVEDKAMVGFIFDDGNLISMPTGNCLPIKG